MDTLWLTLGIALGSSLGNGKPTTVEKLLAPLASLFAALGSVATVLVLLRFSAQSCDFGTLYQSCFHVPKYILVSVLVVGTFVCALFAWFVAANEVNARDAAV
jgi:hypothetical protein